MSDVTRRDLLKLLAIGATAGLAPRALAEAPTRPSACSTSNRL